VYDGQSGGNARETGFSGTEEARVFRKSMPSTLIGAGTGFAGRNALKTVD
jgi:hypothetical protein